MRLGLPLLRRERASASSPTSPSRTDARQSFVRYEPLGPVLAVMPWNFPFWQVFRFAAPALMAGNVGLLKHASNVPQCALAIEEIFRRAGFPDGVFQTLLVGSDRVAALIEDPPHRRGHAHGQRGRGRLASAARRDAQLKKAVLELGGSDPFLVMPTRRPRDSRGDGRQGAHDQQRPVLHRRQALHRAREDRRRFRAALRRGHGRAQGRRPDGSRDRRRPPRDAGHPRRGGRAGAQDGRGRRAACAWAAGRSTGPGTSTRRRCWPTSRPAAPRADEEIFGPVASLFAFREPRRGASRRQPHAVRPRRLGLDEGPRPSASASSRASRRAPSSSTGWSRAIRGCPSAASSSPASAASSRSTASASSST